ncbi:MAG: isoleucine--tRNA ligase, partial [Candidatus Heimdallarchaeaceae archaeon]
MDSKRVFETVKAMQEFAKEEEKILEFWEKKQIFDKSRKKNKGKKLFRWLEGPPTANGKPHMGHVLTRSIKDVFLRYKTMKGYDVQPRIAGWDTHGLPVEREVEKELGIKDKKEIENFGIREFNLKCKESVFKYEKSWRDMTYRIGFWLDMDHPYITLDENYIESVWWSLKQIWNKGLMYLGYKVVPYCTRCGTPLSSHEVGQGMRETTDPSIYVKFRALDFDDTYFLAWTTTPWTLISNVCLTVHPDIDYVLVDHNGEKLILAEVRAEVLFKGEYKVLQRFKGKDLEHKRYEQLFPYVKTDKEAFFVTLADYVTTTDGTGIVHSAPAFGEDDAQTGQKYGLPVINPVLEDGTFDERITDFTGLHVKKADPKIIQQLKDRGLLWKKESYKHTYPFCPRCDTPLLYYSTPTWYIEMTKMREKLLANNEKIFWKPEHLKYGRFGNFIDTVRDWALSRNRYWGTPLPIWECKNGHRTFVGSRKELQELYRKPFKKDFSLHRPWVDEITFKCPECGEETKRVPYVIDCWYDSGSAPFAQYHYPFENKELFEEHFPFDWICESIDQSRGWFYTLLAISTLLFDTSAYKSVLTMGLILDEKGKKLSKSLGNYIPPEEVIDVHGADAVRWYLYSNPTWNNTRFSERLVQDALRKFILTLWNTYAFFISNANVDNFNPKNFKISLKEKPELDRWLISELNYLIKSIDDAMSDLSVHLAVKAFEKFVIDKFSNWYLRQSRRRFWKEEL